MKLSKQKIEIKDLPDLTKNLLLAIKNGDKKIENIRCVYKTENSSVFNVLMPYDFIDLQPQPKIIEFYLYQVLDS